MKKILCLLLAVLLLAGCQSPAAETTQAPTLPQVTESIPAETDPDAAAKLPQAGELGFANPGKARIAYTGNRSYVQYVTSVEDLPDEKALSGYDAAFFESGALLIVVETVNSGSVQLEIESIKLSGNTAEVCVKRTMDGDIGTADMATWMLWAEVEKGLEYTWTLENASQPPQGEKY